MTSLASTSGSAIVAARTRGSSADSGERDRAAPPTTGGDCGGVRPRINGDGDDEVRLNAGDDGTAIGCETGLGASVCLRGCATSQRVTLDSATDRTVASPRKRTDDAAAAAAVDAMAVDAMAVDAMAVDAGLLAGLLADAGIGIVLAACDAFRCKPSTSIGVTSATTLH